MNQCWFDEKEIEFNCDIFANYLFNSDLWCPVPVVNCNYIKLFNCFILRSLRAAQVSRLRGLVPPVPANGAQLAATVDQSAGRKLRCWPMREQPGRMPLGDTRRKRQQANDDAVSVSDRFLRIILRLQFQVAKTKMTDSYHSILWIGERMRGKLGLEWHRV